LFWDTFFSEKSLEIMEIMEQNFLKSVPQKIKAPAAVRLRRLQQTKPEL